MNPAQLFNPTDRSFTYVVFDEKTREALVIDPSGAELARDVATLRRMNLRVHTVLATSGTAQAVADAKALAAHTQGQLWQAGGGTSADPSANAAGAAGAEQLVVRLGQTQVQILPTPGYSPAAVCVYWPQTTEGDKAPGDARAVKRHVFTGLSLLIGEGAPLPAGADAQALAHSVQTQLFTLPGTTIVWPGRDDNQRSQSTVALEKSLNRQFALGRASAPAQALVTPQAMPTPARPEAAQATPAEGYAGDVPPTLAHAWLQAGEAVLVDVRSDAERAWVGQVPGALNVAWKQWPGMAENANFNAELMQALQAAQTASAASANPKVLMLCRSGVRSVAAARRATELGLTAYNILEGFEGDLDSQGHRGQLGGWRRRGLPWQQG